MNIKDHGDWERYVPKENPFAHINTHNILFCQRKTDQRDWYEYQKSELRGKDTIKATLLKLDDEWTVQTTARDPSFLFPAGHKLIELDEPLQIDHETLRGMRADLSKQALLPKLPWPVTRTAFLTALNEAGMLEKWESMLSHANAQTKLALSAERPFMFNDRHLRSITNRLNIDDAKLEELFDEARKQ